jgi:hypothetical protein
MKGFLPCGYLMFLLAGVVCWPATSLAGDAPQTRDCRLRQLASIDLKIGTVVLVPVALDGVPAFMGLNTSIPISTISQRAATEMKFPVGKNPHAFVNSPGLVSINSLSLGSYDIGKVQLLVTVGPPFVNPGLPPQVGSFALPTLFGVDYELDFAHNKLNLFSNNHCPGNVVYWTDKAAAIPYTLDKIGIPVFPIELDGKKLTATLQAGGSHARLKTDFSKELYGFDEHSPGIRSDTSDSGKTVNHYRAMKMTLPGLSVTNADVELVAGSKGCIVSKDSGPEHSATYQNCFGNPPLTLGLDLLRHLRLYFATEEHVLYVTAADAGRPAAASEQ